MTKKVKKKAGHVDAWLYSLVPVELTARELLKIHALRADLTLDEMASRAGVTRHQMSECLKYRAKTIPVKVLNSAGIQLVPSPNGPPTLRVDPDVWAVPPAYDRSATKAG